MVMVPRQRPGPLPMSPQQTAAAGTGRGLPAKPAGVGRGLFGAMEGAYESPLGQLGLSLLLSPTRRAQADAISGSAGYAGQRAENRKTREQRDRHHEAGTALREAELGLSRERLGMQRQQFADQLRARQEKREADRLLAETIAPSLGLSADVVGKFMRSERGQDYVFSRIPETSTLERNVAGAKRLLDAGQIDDQQFRDYMTSITSEGRSQQFNVNLGKNMAPTFDEAGNIIGAQPIPGTPEAEKAETARRARESADANRRRAADIVLQDIDRTASIVTDSPFWTTGSIGNVTQNVPGTPAHDARNLTQTIRANIGFDRLQQMREESPTGGALGQVTVEEIKRLEAVLGSIELSQTSEQLTQNLARLREVYLDIVHGEGNRPPGTPPMPGTVVDGYRFKGGDPAQQSSWERAR